MHTRSFRFANQCTQSVVAAASIFAHESHGALLLQDEFNHVNGALTKVGTGQWISHSGSAGQVHVSEGWLSLTQSASEDVHAPLEGGPYGSASNTILYAALKLKFAALPTGAGAYFVHFKDGANTFRCRLFAVTNGAGAGAFRLGIGAGSTTASALFERDLSPESTYIVLLRYHISEATARLWINPVREADGFVASSDKASPAAVASIAFRQSLSGGNGMGTVLIDEVRVASTFAEALASAEPGTKEPPPPPPTPPPPRPGPPPKIEFRVSLDLIRHGDAPVNQFTEQVLLPGERVLIEAISSVESGEALEAAWLPAAGSVLPTWSWSAVSPNSKSARWEFLAAESDAGRLEQPEFVAWNANGTNRVAWTVYVPTRVEQRIAISEFLANPTTDKAAPNFNPLRRAEPAPEPGADDEFVELVNASSDPMSLQGWTLWDSARLQHRFAGPFVLASSSAVVIYGGPPQGHLPAPDILTLPSSEQIAGLGLNNTGGDSIWLRNAEGRLLTRVVFESAVSGISMARPGWFEAFTVHTNISTRAASPGVKPDGTAYRNEIEPESTPAITLAITTAPDGSIELLWNADPARTYTVTRASSLGDPFVVRVSGLRFESGAGNYAEPASAGAAYYRIRSP